ncbi:MAG: hypothetical protein OEW19_17820 [Acidobacteriota bacterium]|nr:hypothetical protein [Acidobacteriota bacterium]
MRAFVVACLLTVSAPLSAITVKPLSFTELVEVSTAVVHGRVSGVVGQWTPDRRGIESLVTVEVIDYFKGNLGARVTVRVPGGRAGGFVNLIPGAPRLAQGDAVVLFLTATGPSIPVVTGTTQGVYRVTADSRTGGLVVVPPLIDTGASAGRLVRGDRARRPVPIDSFEAAVASAQVGR